MSILPYWGTLGVPVLDKSMKLRPNEYARFTDVVIRIDPVYLSSMGKIKDLLEGLGLTVTAHCPIEGDKGSVMGVGDISRGVDTDTDEISRDIWLLTGRMCCIFFSWKCNFVRHIYRNGSTKTERGRFPEEHSYGQIDFDLCFPALTQIAMTAKDEA